MAECSIQAHCPSKYQWQEKEAFVCWLLLVGDSEAICGPLWLVGGLDAVCGVCVCSLFLYCTLQNMLLYPNVIFLKVLCDAAECGTLWVSLHSPTMLASNSRLKRCCKVHLEHFWCQRGQPTVVLHSP